MGQPGLPLLLQLTVERPVKCTPINNAEVEIWRCDAGVIYSGYGASSAAGNAPAYSPTPIRTVTGRLIHLVSAIVKGV